MLYCINSFRDPIVRVHTYAPAKPYTYMVTRRMFYEPYEVLLSHFNIFERKFRACYFSRILHIYYFYFHCKISQFWVIYIGFVRLFNGVWKGLFISYAGVKFFSWLSLQNIACDKFFNITH